MAFIGNTNTTQAFTPAVDYFSGNASTTAFTLSRPVASVAQVQVNISNVPQNPSDAYTVSGNTITFTSAPPSGTNNIYVYYTSPITQVITPGQGTVGTTQIQNGVTVNFADGTAAAPSITTTGDTNTGIFFPAADTIAFSEGGVESMRIGSSGNLGIGTTSPTNGKLVISGNSVTTSQGIRLVADSADARFICESATLGAGILGTFSTHSQLFYTNSAERMRIDSGGGVRINNTSNATFSAQLNTQFTSAFQCGQYLKVTDTSASQSMFIFGNTNSDAVGSIATSGAGTSYNTSSDYRLKQDITPMTGALAKVATLKPVTYKWKFDGSDGEGFIAHELAEVCPNAVTGEKDAVRTVEIQDEDGNVTGTEVRPIHQGIDTSFLVATLTAAIQELKALVDTQSSTITALTTRITALENK